MLVVPDSLQCNVIPLWCGHFLERLDESVRWFTSAVDDAAHIRPATVDELCKLAMAEAQFLQDQAQFVTRNGLVAAGGRRTSGFYVVFHGDCIEYGGRMSGIVH